MRITSWPCSTAAAQRRRLEAPSPDTVGDRSRVHGCLADAPTIPRYTTHRVLVVNVEPSRHVKLAESSSA
eukprot:scaffold204992_cov33-Tisochrysis_lutea.AAC.1